MASGVQLAEHWLGLRPCQTAVVDSVLHLWRHFSRIPVAVGCSMHRLLAHFCFGVAAPFSVACVLGFESYRRAIRNLAVSGSRYPRGSLEQCRAQSRGATLSLERVRGLAASTLRLVHSDCVPPGFLSCLAHFVRRLCGTVFRPITEARPRYHLTKHTLSRGRRCLSSNVVKRL
jgi:hypothetical protein